MQARELLMGAEPEAVRLLLVDGNNQLLKAVLPRPSAHTAAPLLCQSLSLWTGQRLHVVLSAADWDDLSGFGLDDGFADGLVRDHYDSIIVLGDRPRGQHLAGLGSFSGLLRLRGAR